MAFIGIMGEKQRYEFIKNKIQQDMNKNNISIININKKSINNLQNVKFDAIVLLNSINIMMDEIKAVNNICKNVNYFIINTDLETKKNPFSNIKTNIITFGLNQKATVTFSSIQDENALISVQREFKNINNNIIEQGEYNYKMNKVDRTNLHGILTFFIIKNVFYNKNN